MKPSYSTTKAHLFASSLMAWIVILALTAGAIYGSEQAVSFGMMAVPTMAGMLCAMLGLHRRYGSKDFEAAHRGRRNELPSLPPYDPRADPRDNSGEQR